MLESIPPMEQLEHAILDPTSPIGMRMRAAYYLRQIYTNNSSDNDNDDDAKQKIQHHVIEILSKGLLDENHGSLMRHEFAYVMGQLADTKSCLTLQNVLCNSNDCTMVRHEAAEALGAIGSPDSREILKQVQNDSPTIPELEETCRIALDLIDYKLRQQNDANTKEAPPIVCSCMINPYSSIDPAPASPEHEHLTCEQLGDIVLSSSSEMFDRYRAMFSLRNRGGKDAVSQLCRALVEDASSALLRHEVAYVLGQLQHPSSIDALEESLRRLEEHSMVRHESAEALGAIEGSSAEDWNRIEAILSEFTHDQDRVVRESCLVALDAADYWGHFANNSNNNNNENENNVDENDDQQQKTTNDNDGEEEEEKKQLSSFGHQKALSGVVVVNQ